MTDTPESSTQESEQVTSTQEMEQQPETVAQETEAAPPPPEQPYYHYPGQNTAQQQKRSGGCGCWVVGIITLLIALGFVIAGLFLPPFNLGDRLFGPQYAMFSADGNAVPSDDGNFIISVNPTNYGVDFGAELSSTNINSFLTDSSEEWIKTASRTLPTHLTLLSHIYSINTTGDAPSPVMLTINIPSEASNKDLIDLYTWDSQKQSWAFVPSKLIVEETGQMKKYATVDTVPEHIALFRAAPIAPTIMATLNIGQTLSPEATDLISILSPIGMQPSLPNTPQRTLVGNPAPGFSIGSNYLVMPIIRNFSDPRATDPDTIISIINNQELRKEHIQTLTSFTTAGGYSGIFIDYRDIPTDHRNNYSSFIQDLAQNLHGANLLLGVVIPQADNIEGTWETRGYDWKAIGKYADYVQIDFGLNPAIFAPGDDRLVEAMLRWAVNEQVNRYKLIAGITALSIQETVGEFTSITYSDALAPLGNVELDVAETTGNTATQGSEIRISLSGYDALPGVDTTIQAPFINYLEKDGTALSTMWLTTGESLLFKLNRLNPFSINGVAFNDLLSKGIANDIYETLLNYKIQLPATPSATELMLNWRIESTEGKITEFTTNFNEDIVVTLTAPDGNYAVNVDVVNGDMVNPRNGAPLALFAPTITPTPLPTNTPLPTATTTPTLVPIVPTNTPLPTVAQNNQSQQPTIVPLNPVNPGAGSIAGGAFEYGGHMDGIGEGPSGLQALRSSGMSWIKIQIRYGHGDLAQAAINNAHSNGFKILIGLMGSPPDLEAGGGGYIQQFATFAGQVAAMGPDAIEIWNEPNIDREWPRGTINGANYTDLLRHASSAIKAVNPNIMVISAALAPTGAEAAFPGQVVNDDNFLRQMVNAGALSHVDCVGMHYNEGTVSPRTTVGDFRDNYYTRYLPTMINTYWDIIGGQRPICITELGYLTAEGYGGLPGFFSWAEGNTLAEHAAWLADAAAYSSQTGRVRIMIVWNVNFTHYDGNDPMAGYAMVRPNGDCPACRAFAGAR